MYITQRSPLALLAISLFTVSAVSLTLPDRVNADTVDVPASVLEAEQQRIDVIDRIKDTVLAVFSASGGGGGSGVCITPDGYALTNFHVVKPCGAHMRCGMADGKVYDAVIVGIDPTGDVALIKMLGRDDFPYSELGDSDLLRVGDPAYVLGNPFLLANNLSPTVTVGIISGVHRYQYPSGTILEYADCIQTDASINPGNSGGPLFSDAGEVIGINGRGSFEKRGRVNVGVGWAISSNQIEQFMGYLRSGRIVDHATAGFTVTSDDSGRVVVDDILERSDAFRRGLRYDDEIVSFGGRPIDTVNTFKNVLGIFPKGWRIPMSFRQDGQRHDVLVRLEGVHSAAELLGNAQGGSKQLPQPKIIPHPGPDRKDAPDDAEKSEDPYEPEVPEKPKRVQLPHGERPKPELPPQIKEIYEERQGYANYHFNQMNRDRVLDSWRSLPGGKQLTAANTVWEIAGPIVGGDTFRFVLDGAKLSYELPSESDDWLPTAPLFEHLDPIGSGGLLPALYFWHRLATNGPEQFGEVRYQGTAPMPGRDEPVDVIVATHAGADAWCYYDPQDGRLLELEFFGDPDIDPCDLLFHDYQTINGIQVPGRIEARVGDQPFATFVVEQFEVK